MRELKKLCLIPLLILSTTALYFSFKPALNEYLEIFFKPNFGIYEFGMIALFITLTSLTFVIFVTLSQNFLYALIASTISSLTAFLFFDFNLSLTLSVCFLITFILGYFNLQTSLKSYINFSPQSILSPHIKLLNTFLLLSLTFAYFLNTNSIIKTQGFQMPKTLIEWAVDLTLEMQGMSVKSEKRYLAQSLTPEQMELLRQNPDVLKQFGVNADDLKEFVAPSNPQTTSPNQNAVQVVPQIPGVNVKDTLIAQTGNMLDLIIKPYEGMIPFLFAFMFFSFASLLNWILSLLLYPLISLIFLILEKSGFVKFEKEMREVKKIII